MRIFQSSIEDFICSRSFATAARGPSSVSEYSLLEGVRPTPAIAICQMIGRVNDLVELDIHLSAGDMEIWVSLIVVRCACPGDIWQRN